MNRTERDVWALALKTQMMQPQAKACQQPQEAGKEQGMASSPEPPEGKQPYQHLGFSQVTLYLHFWPPEL